MPFPGPTANLRGYNRRSGRAGTVWVGGEMRGEVVSVEWGVEVEQIAIQIPGTYQDEMKPGAETRRGTFRYHDLDDRWRLHVWNFLEARRRGDRAAAAFPEFTIITKVSDPGAPYDSTWAVEGCQFFQLDGGHGQDDDNLQRDVPFVYRHERPLEAFAYGANGTVVTRA